MFRLELSWGKKDKNLEKEKLNEGKIDRLQNEIYDINRELFVLKEMHIRGLIKTITDSLKSMVVAKNYHETVKVYKSKRVKLARDKYGNRRAWCYVDDVQVTDLIGQTTLIKFFEEKERGIYATSL